VPPRCPRYTVLLDPRGAKSNPPAYRPRQCGHNFQPSPVPYANGALVSALEPVLPLNWAKKPFVAWFVQLLFGKAVPWRWRPDSAQIHAGLVASKPGRCLIAPPPPLLIKRWLANGAARCRFPRVVHLLCAPSVPSAGIFTSIHTLP